MIDPTEYDPNSRDSTDDPDFVSDANHIGDLNEMVVGDNDHGDAIPEPKCGVCLCNRALEEDFKDSLDAHDEMRLEIVRLTKERDEGLVEIERLRNDLDGSQLAYRGASYDRDRMRKERDEARRMYLASTCSEDEIIHEMKRHGWDCFKEDGKPCQ